jgi:hypothetical protein
MWNKDRAKTRRILSSNITSEKWTQENPSERQVQQEERLESKYGESSLIDLKSQKAIFWLSVDKIIQPRNVF